MRIHEKTSDVPQGDSFSAPDYLDMAAENHAFASVAAIRPSRMTMTTAAGPVQLPAARVTASFFAALGVQPSRGRGFSPETDKAGGGLRLALVGVAVGIPAALLLTRALGAALYQVSAADPVTFAIVAIGVAAVAALASFLPARRATRVDPATPLRAE